jgi:hypothetical protein
MPAASPVEVAMEDNTQQIAREILAVEARMRDEQPAFSLSALWNDLLLKLMNRLRPKNSSRRFVRLPMFARAQVELPDGTSVDMHTTALGNGGMGLRDPSEQLLPGMKVRVRVVELLDRRWPQEIEGLVKWRREGEVGLQFELPIRDPAGFQALYRSVWQSYIEDLAYGGREAAEAGPRPLIS